MGHHLPSPSFPADYYVSLDPDTPFPVIPLTVLKTLPALFLFESIMRNIFADTEGRQGVFKNEKALLPEFLPPTLLHRDPHIKELAFAMKPAIQNSRPDNLFLFGPTGTGKTSCVKYAFQQLQEYSQRVACVYVNCWEFAGKQAVLSKLTEHFEIPLPRRGLASDEVFQRILQRAKYDKKSLVICLDEADRLFHRHDESLLYEFSRAQEHFGISIGILAISNNSSLIAMMDERARSSLRFKPLEFKAYTPIQLKQILGERAKDAFVPGSFSEEVIGLCAGHSAKHKGDARVAIEALRQSARVAERKGHREITVGDVKEAFAAGDDASLKKNVDFMNPNERLLLEILQDAKKDDTDLTSREVYTAFSDKKKDLGEEALSERQIRNYLEVFERAKIVETKLIDAPGSEKGKTKRIRVIR
ncbi:AAA family ATPase [Candidatus Micrarchaeota archaeon]|nr:AAA family ATPase [Candidatus Micrarchaeota archaeon]